MNDAEPAAVEQYAPEYNDAHTDPDTDGGLTPHKLASHVIPSERYVPNLGNADTDFAAPINDQVSSSGTAAAREAAGIWGHGTMKVVEGIEPVIRDGDQLGNDYFTTWDRPNAGSAAFMTPSASADPATVAQSQATGTANARAAVAVSQYQAMLDGLQKGL